ncbi:MAG: hypothetical protein HC906_05220 [Bacteroidales bacterium]|nr:hypothetical protein [Bacteroidales bacterium]
MNKNLKLLSDLNLDSIKAGSFLNDVFKTMKVSGKIKASAYLNASLEEIIHEIEMILPEKSHVQSNTGESPIEDQVLDVISSKTGFPKNNLKFDFRLLNDLNLDSIKAGALIAEFAKKFGIQGKLQAVSLANASIQEIIHKIKTELPSEKTSADHGKDEIAAFLFDLVEKKTGFPKNQLNNDLKLLNDLNLDSIKATSVIAELNKKFSIQGKVEPSKYLNATIGEIIEKAASLVAVSPEIEKPDNQKQHWVRSFEAKVFTEPIEIDHQKISEYWSNKNIGLVTSESGKQLCEKLFAEISGNASVTQIQLNELENHSFEVLLVVVPPVAINASELSEVVHLFSTIAAHSTRFNKLGFIQTGQWKILARRG